MKGTVLGFKGDVMHVPSTYTPTKRQTPEYWYREFLVEAEGKQFAYICTSTDRKSLEDTRIGDKINVRGKI